DVGLDVAAHPGVAVPVPGPADVTGLVHEADGAEPGLTQPRPGEQAAEARADDEDVHLVEQRCAIAVPGDVRIVDVVPEIAGRGDVLRGAVRAQPPFALGPVAA